MIKRLDTKKRLSFKDEIAIYMEAFKNTTVGINIMFTKEHQFFNRLSFMLRYNVNRDNKKELKKLKQLLDKYTTVEYVAEKTYPGQTPRYSCKFTKFEFPEDIKQQINEQYNKSIAPSKTPKGDEGR